MRPLIKPWLVALAAGVALIGLSGGGHTFGARLVAATAPATGLHYAPNGNSAAGAYGPQRLGFNVADVSSRGELDSAPTGVLGLVWLNGCSGATSTFTSTAGSFAGDSRLFGFYIGDEVASSSCPASHLKASSDWVHENLPGAKTFIVPENLCASSAPCYSDSSNTALTPATTDVDLFGLSPYPCRTDLNGCDYTRITKFVEASENVGVPQADIVPMYQAFGGNDAWADDSGGYYAVPTASQEQEIMSTWAAVVPTPVFDYTYSWGVQDGDTALADAPSSLQQVFLDHNTGTASTSASPPTSAPRAQSTPTPAPQSGHHRRHHRQR